MTSIQRNAPCPCGSGVKYKKCRLNNASLQGTDMLVGGSLPREDDRYPLLDRTKAPDLDVHGYLRRETIVNTFVYSELPEGVTEQPRPEGYPGTYDVEFTFQPPSRIVIDSNNFNCGADLAGASLIAIAGPVPRTTKEADRIRVDILAQPLNIEESPTHLAFLLIPNDDGFLATAKVSLHAANLADASQRAWKGFAPILSKLSFVHDVPLEVHRIRTEERATKSASCTFTHHMYRKVGWDPNLVGGFASISVQYHPLVYYREALCATSPFYQYLCYYKVIEIILRMRQARAKTAKQEGKTPQIVTERLAEHDWLAKNVGANLLASVLGKKVTDLRDNVFRTVRNRIAHELLEDEEPTNLPAEDMLNPDEVYKVLPLLKHVARFMIVTELTPAVSS